jgi:hypothetical protein
MENDYATRSKMNCKVAEHGCRVMLELQDLAPDDGIEGSLEAHVRRITNSKRQISKRPFCRPTLRGRHGSVSPVNADNFPRWPDQFGRQERNVACAATDIEYTHPCGNASLVEDRAGEGIDDASLCTQALKFSLRVPKDIGAGQTCARG